MVARRNYYKCVGCARARVRLNPSSGEGNSERNACARRTLPVRNSKSESLTHLRRCYFCCLSEAVGENLFELRGDTDFSEGASEFSRRPIGSENSGDKKPNKRQRCGFAFFGYFFGEAKK
jgi:hypothetical protein